MTSTQPQPHGPQRANEAGLRFERDGSEGPFLADVLLLDGKVKMIDTESLGEFDDGDDRVFTAEPLVYSPLGEFIRSWWVGTAATIDMPEGQMCPRAEFQAVLNGFGTLNWLLFKWKPEQLLQPGKQVWLEAPEDGRFRPPGAI